MTTEALTTVAIAKAWLGITDTASDAILGRLITVSTQAILNYCSTNSFLYNLRTDGFNGQDTRAIHLSDFPVYSIVSLTVDDQTIPAAVGSTGTGYVLESFNGFPPGNFQQVILNGYRFTRGLQNVQVSYMAGYAILNEKVVASTTAAACKQPFGRFVRDEGVNYVSTGLPLTAVAAAPTAGQYTVTSDGQYAFSAADAGQQVYLDYSYVPDALEQACLEMVGERIKYRNRIGERSRSLGGQETVTYADSKMSNTVKEILLNFEKVMQP